MFHDPDVPEPVRALAERATPQLVEDLHLLGLYVKAQAITSPVDADDHYYLALTGPVGSVAFSDRVLRPDVVADEDLLADIGDATVADEYDRIRRQILGGGDD